MAPQLTPVRASLKPESSLLTSVRDGIQALKSSHRAYVEATIREVFADSLDLDSALQAGREQEHRWDYLLGHAPSKAVIGLEPHSAKNDEVSTVIAKRKAALVQLRHHLKPGAKVTAWLWVASGNVDFQPLEKARLRLDQNGIGFVGKQLVKKHLDTHLPAITVDSKQKGEQSRPRPSNRRKRKDRA